MDSTLEILRLKFSGAIHRFIVRSRNLSETDGQTSQISLLFIARMLLIFLSVTISAALTAVLITSMGSFDMLTRLFISGGFIFLMAVVLVPAWSVLQERRHELRMASFDQRQELYYGLIDSVLTVLDNNQRSVMFYTKELEAFLRDYRTELLVYGSASVLTLTNEFLSKAQFYCEAANDLRSNRARIYLRNLLEQLIEAIHQDLEESDQRCSMDVLLQQVIKNNPQKPELRRYK